jgi:hypothetical protein
MLSSTAGFGQEQPFNFLGSIMTINNPSDFKQVLDLRSLSYAERQLIIVLPDEVVATARRPVLDPKPNENLSDWKSVAARIAKTSLSLTAFGVGIELTTDAINAWAAARESGLNLLQISRTEAKDLTFPPGHPREQAIYVAHPALPSVYYTTATFHRMAFEHKFSEAILLLMSLGASKITVEHVRGWSREFAAKMSTSLDSIEVTADAGHSAKSGSTHLFEATLDNPQAPVLPSDLVWYPHEPTWQAVAQGRIKFGLSQFSLTVNYEDDFGINAGLKMRVQKAGLDLGGTFEDHTATTWKIHGDFAPKS